MSKDSSTHTISHPTPLHTPAHARIGPNALIQTVRALQEICGLVQATAILEQGQQAHLIDYTPTEMVPEADFNALVLLLTAHLGVEQATHVLRVSGQYTARYLLQHRIPRPFQRLLKVLPRRLALALLLFAISKNAWTFVGSGTFTYRVGKETRLTVASGIHSKGAVCGFYGGTFATLIQQIIDVEAQVQATRCQVGEDSRCEYVVLFGS